MILSNMSIIRWHGSTAVLVDFTRSVCTTQSRTRVPVWLMALRSFLLSISICNDHRPDGDKNERIVAMALIMMIIFRCTSYFPRTNYSCQMIQTQRWSIFDEKPLRNKLPDWGCATIELSLHPPTCSHCQSVQPSTWIIIMICHHQLQ